MWVFRKNSSFSVAQSIFIFYFVTYLLIIVDGSLVKNFVRKPMACVPIPPDLKLCRNVGYPEMVIPNLLNHDSLEEVKHQASSFVPLLNKGCHPHLQQFLCSLFAPVCLPPESAVTGPIPPCKSLCVSVKKACTPLMRRHNFDWPLILNCSKFTKEEPCVNLGSNPHTNTSKATVQTPNICAPCGTELDTDSLHDNYCASEFVLKIRPRKIRQHKSKGIRKIYSLRKKRVIYKRGPLTAGDLKRLKLVVRGSRRCQCPQLDHPSRSKSKKRSKRKRQNLLVMGRKVETELLVTVLHSWPKRSRVLKLASKTRFEARQCPEFGNSNFS